MRRTGRAAARLRPGRSEPEAQARSLHGTRSKRCSGAVTRAPARPNGRSAATVRIGGRLVGDGQRVLIVAEAGVNHDGSLEKALQLVDAATEAGADVVKFQVFRATELATASARTAAYQKAAAGDVQRDMLARLELTDDDFRQIVGRCRARAIGFLATPFSVPDVDRLVALGVQAIKIASTDLNNVPLLRRAADAGLPLVVSTGASLPEEIRAAMRRLRGWGAADRLILLHCVSGYPTPVEAANVRAVATLRHSYRVPSGFSDHTESTEIAGWAVAAGACLLEKHFTLDRQSPGPDHAMSLDPGELAAYVASARAAEAALGSGLLGMGALESDVRATARKSVVAAQDIPARTLLTASMVTIKRPGGGIAPDQLDAVHGRYAAIDIAADTVLTWDMLR
jgi:N,N'-diacetyllegionaminate synthase